MAKTVVALIGSKRKKNTYSLVTQIASVLKQHDIDTDLVFLYDNEIKDCVGCQACILGKRCALTDDAPSIREKLSKADGIILASPVYMCSISGRMKTFIDRTAD
ncbi:MAG TPA: flavodoxin family protein [Spirochaetia bacterium]|nr:flavodoxin family protein [Spirochaetales bacterium]HOT59068.1 flavodoxin family protein [Spirochaetales bacterium]HPD79855.1 flavodoxin family protein [Spirochaetales bacterium]HQK33090.1 flavodoxin family protein [Spirochaetales bacterium]HRS66313.1 flavodoxin family protein [Spirochaetia bacterium]